MPARSWCHPTLARLIVPVRGEWSRIWTRHPEADGIVIAADTVTTAAASNPVPYHCAPPSRPACPACPACPSPCVPRMPGVSRVPCLPCVLCASLPCLPRVPCLPPYGRRSQIAHRQQVSKGPRPTTLLEDARDPNHRQYLFPRLPCPRREMSYAVRRLRLCLVAALSHATPPDGLPARPRIRAGLMLPSRCSNAAACDSLLLPGSASSCLGGCWFQGSRFVFPICGPRRQAALVQQARC